MLLAVSSRILCWAQLLLRTTQLQADPSDATRQACADLAVAVPELVSGPAVAAYGAERGHYWSSLLRDAEPTCIVRPRTAEDVAAAVRVLNRYPDVQFAVKSGGHTPNPRHSSVHDGVLISMNDVRGVYYDSDTQLAHVKPGGTWNEAIGALEKEGVMILGGRMGLVGVGGLLSQGGVSYLAAEHGLAADNIVEWETVNHKGEIVTVSAESDPELAVAMRGSGNQFGIITKFTVKAYPIGSVWGGYRIYSDDKADELFAALHDFTPDNNDDPRGAFILTSMFLIGGSRSWVMYYFYNGPEPPSDGLFGKFLAIKPTVDKCKTRSYANLLHANGVAAGLLNARNIFRTYTLPYMANRPGMYREITDKYHSIVRPFLQSRHHTGVQCSVNFQPFPAVVGRRSQEHGGNAVGLSANDLDRVLLEIQCAWLAAREDEPGMDTGRQLTEWLDGKMAEWTTPDEEADAYDDDDEYTYEHEDQDQHQHVLGSATRRRRLPSPHPEHDPRDAYLPLIMNEATFDQNVTQRYRDYHHLKAVQARVDPEGFWRTRAGGWTY